MQKSSLCCSVPSNFSWAFAQTPWASHGPHWVMSDLGCAQIHRLHPPKGRILAHIFCLHDITFGATRPHVVSKFSKDNSQAWSFDAFRGSSSCSLGVPHKFGQAQGRIVAKNSAFGGPGLWIWTQPSTWRPNHCQHLSEILDHNKLHDAGILQKKFKPPTYQSRT